MEKLTSTTFKETALGDVKPVILIGGNDVDFIPNVNMSFFSDEFYINLNNKSITKSKDVTSVDGKISHKGEEWYIKDGRLKWDTVFNSCPISMKLEYELKHSENIKFVYQDSLENDLKNKKIDQDLYDHSKRPEEITGSYSIEISKKDNKYKSGKVGHIYRPFVIDADGKKEWATIEIKDGKLTISLPDAWMQKAKYPVRLDPTFGYTSKGGTALNYASLAFFTRFTSGGAGDATSISAYVMTAAATTFKYAIFSDKDGSDNITLLRGTAEGSESSYDNWKELALTSNYTITGSTVYALGLISSDADCTFYYDAGDANQEGFDASGKSYAQQWANSTCGFPSALKFSIYATYSTGGGSSIPAIMHHLTKNVGAQ